MSTYNYVRLCVHETSQKRRKNNNTEASEHWKRVLRFFLFKANSHVSEPKVRT